MLRTVHKCDFFFIFLTLVKVHPGRKYRTMVIDATITKSNIHTTIERAEGLKHDLQEKAEQHSRLKLVCKCILKKSQAE